MAFDAGTLFYSVDAKTDGLLSAERQVNQSSRRMESSLGRAEKATRSFNGSVSDALGPLGNLKTLVAAVGSAMAAQKVIAYADAWTSAQNSIRQVTDSQQELTDVTDRLMQVANDSRSSFGATADLYSRLTRSTQGLGVSQDRVIALTETINKSFAASGATAQEASNAIVQLGQGLAAGALRGDEFNAVAEQAPVILRAVAAQTGKTIGQLREFAAEGGITADLLVKSLEGYADTVENDFTRAVATFGQQTTVANNNLMEFIGNSQAVRTVVTSAGDTLVYLSENIDDVASVASLAATAIGVRLVQALTAAVARQAAAALGAASLTTAYSTMGARAATSAIAVRGLSAAMATLGGPVGVAILAATAIYQFRDSLFGAESRAAKLSARVQELTGDIDNLTDAQIDNKIADFGGTLADLATKADQARQKVQQAQAALNDNSLKNSGVLGVSGVNITGYTQAQQELSGVTSEIEAQKEAIKQLEALKSSRNERSRNTVTPPATTDVDDSVAKKAAKEAERLQQELESRRRMVEEALATESEAAYREYQERNLEIQTLYEEGSAQQQQLLERNNAEYAAKVAEMNQAELEAEKQHQAAMLQAQRDSNIARIQELTGFTEQAAAKIVEFQENSADPLTFLNESLGNAFTSLDDTISNAFANAVSQGESLNDTLRSIGQTVLASLLQSFVKLGVQMALNAAIGQAAQTAASATASATGASMASAYAPAAALASLASFGGNAAPAAAALIGTTALSSTLAMAGGRQYGGSVSAGNAYRVTEDGKPELYTQGTQSYLLPGRNGKVTSNNDMTSGNSGGIVVNVQNNTSAEVTASDGGTDANDRRIINLAVNEVASQLSRRSGAVASGLTSGYNVKGKSS
ncbi:tape measure protein [Phytohalomonas tamaricis]|uniref:tape measure protein n=1 Tax=Phytohalomonas tamaricis TaxID=2081032 RepID=UPI000D0ABB7E|nr:tape measure protein [Phytohalomonas tamaricis]